MKVNREIVRLQLLRWCAAPGDGKAYFRPLVCRGNIEAVDIFLAQTNPATPIPPPLNTPGLDAEKARDLHEQFRAKYPLEDYVRRLADYDAFSEMLQDTEQALGKKNDSVIRQRMEVFADMNPRADVAVADAFINAYPAKDSAALKKEDRKTVERGYDLFFEMLQLFRPSWVVLLGKPAIDEGANFFLTRFGIPDFKKKWADIDQREPRLIPLANVKLHGNKCRILGTRNFEKRAVSGIPDSDYSDERFLRFCRAAWEQLGTPKA